MNIQVLPPTVAAQIAAGEIVERPASVVKELIENAIDASATQISVAIERGGTKSIRVQDNGTGIPASQVQTAFSRHATSKLRTADDLLNIATLGFRGEALPSIAAVSVLTCITRTADSEAATRHRINYGEQEESPRTTGGPVGTTITVNNLFGNQPARLKFLRTKPTEAGQVQRIIARHAMAHPHIRFTYSNDGNETFRTNGTGKLLETILNLMGNDPASKMLPVNLDTDEVNVSGYVGNTDLHRSNRNDISVTVNGRCIQDSNLAYAIEQGYSNSLPMGRRPMAVIRLLTPNHLVDVNAHPTKQQVRFRHESKIFSAIQNAVRETLSTHGAIHHVAKRSFGTARYIGPSHPAPNYAGPTQEPQTPRPADEPSTSTMPPQTPSNYTKIAGPPDQERRSPSPAEPLVITELLQGNNLRETIPELRLIGQTQRTFILADGPDGLYLIDQHAAHERVIFDEVFRQRTNQPADSQQLLIPEQATLNEFQQHTLEKHLELIEQQGFILFQIKDQLWQINALPLPLTAKHCPRPEHTLQRLLDEFAAEEVISSPQQAVAATIACHSATRAGDALGDEEMKAIIERLAQTPEPHRCPHGRPTIVQISRFRLDQEFRRR